MPRANFTDAQVRNIRREYADDVTLSVADLARKYGFSPMCLGNLISGKSYPHVDGAVPVRNPGGWGRQPNMDPDLREEVLRRLENGESTYRINVDTGVSTSQIHFLRHGCYTYLKS